MLKDFLKVKLFLKYHFYHFIDHIEKIKRKIIQNKIILSEWLVACECVQSVC